MAPRLPAGLEREVGTPGVRAVGGILETFEETAELKWPNDVIVYDAMRRTDAQTAGVLRGSTLPVRRTRWRVGSDGDGVDPRVRRFIEVNLGLNPEARARARRRREGIVWDEFLGTALKFPAFGHYPFEQVYRLAPPGPELGEVNGMPPRLAHLRKLAPRPPRSISGFDIARDGGLDAIRQYVIDPNGQAREVAIPVTRLVVFVNDREGADWTGESILRASYKHWLIKDQLLRIGAMAVERNGMGLPVVNYPPSGSKAEALEIARRARAGEESGVALPEGYTFDLVGVSGQVRDELPLVKYHDQAIGKNALAMVLDLGHDAGARSLGDTFVELYTMAQNALAGAVEETVTEYVIRDLVALNFGEDEPYPELLADEIEPTSTLTADALGSLVTAGVIIPDPDLEAELRRRYRLPEANPVEEVTDVPSTEVDPETGLPVGTPGPDGRVLTPGGPVDPNAPPSNDPGRPALVPVAASAGRGSLAARARALAELIDAGA